MIFNDTDISLFDKFVGMYCYKNIRFIIVDENRFDRTYIDKLPIINVLK